MAVLRCCHCNSCCGGCHCDPWRTGCPWALVTPKIGPLGGARVPRVLSTALNLGLGLQFPWLASGEAGEAGRGAGDVLRPSGQMEVNLALRWRPEPHKLSAGLSQLQVDSRPHSASPPVSTLASFPAPLLQASRCAYSVP